MTLVPTLHKFSRLPC